MSKKAIITGASRGIGRGIAQCLAQEGYDIFFTYSTSEKGAIRTKAMVESYGQKAYYMQADFRDTTMPEKVVRQGIATLGGLDLLCPNAAWSDGTMIDNMLVYTDERTRDMINIDFWQYIIACRTAARYWVETGTKGNIVMTSSPHSFRVWLGDFAYGSIKAGISRACQSFAIDLAPYGIRVNCVSPGATNIRTREEYMEEGLNEGDIEARLALGHKIPLGRLGDPTDIGNAVAFLASDKASFITGVTLVVDGAASIPAQVEISKKDDEVDLGWTNFRYAVPGEDWEKSDWLHYGE